MFIDTTTLISGASIVGMLYLMFRVYTLDREMDLIMQKHNDFVEHSSKNFEALKNATLQIADWLEDLERDSEDL